MLFRSQRPRAISTDESNRRANYEERNRAIAAQRSPRTSSPAAGPRNGTHRRDRSQTRFPVNTNSPTAERRNTLNTRNSLEVPSVENSPTVEDQSTNGHLDGVQDQPIPRMVPLARKHAGSLTRNRDSAGSLRGADAAPRGVQLEDKPMED